MSGPPQGPPPGWYEDPSGDGGWRYWNGAAWTSRAPGYEAPSTGSLPTSGQPETSESGPQSPSAMPTRTQRSPEQTQGGFAALWESAGGVVTCTGCNACDVRGAGRPLPCMRLPLPEPTGAHHRARGSGGWVARHRRRLDRYGRVLRLRAADRGLRRLRNALGARRRGTGRVRLGPNRPGATTIVLRV